MCGWRSFARGVSFVLLVVGSSCVTPGARSPSRWETLSCDEVERSVDGGCAKHVYPRLKPIVEFAGPYEQFVQTLELAKESRHRSC